MVTPRGRLRIVALALIVCTVLFWHTRSRSYDYTYSKAPEATLEKTTGVAGEKEIGHFDNDANELRVPTPAYRGQSRSTLATTRPSTTTSTSKTSRSTATAQKTTPPSAEQTEDGWRRVDEDEKERLQEEMEKYKDVQTQANPESGRFLDQTDKTIKTTYHKTPPISDKVDWSRFAYTQYVTNADYLCNSVMIFETLHRLGSKADRLMMYPSFMLDPKATQSDTPHGKLLIQARDKYKVKLMPVVVQHREGADGKSSACASVLTWLTLHSHLGRLLHQTPRLQPNPIRPCPLARLGRRRPAAHGRALPPPAQPRRHAPRLLAPRRVTPPARPVLPGPPHPARHGRVRAHHAQDRNDY
jgi:hypothetical protein